MFPELQRVDRHDHDHDGREFTKQIDYPKGDPRNPLTDEEIEEKFDALAEPVLAADGARRRQGRGLEPGEAATRSRDADGR